MTFLELQKRIVQTRKARKGIANRHDYFEDDVNEDFWNAVYKRALYAANAVIKHYEETGEVNPSNKPKIIWKE